MGLILYFGLVCSDRDAYVRERGKEINYYRSLTLALKRCECRAVMKIADRNIPRYVLYQTSLVSSKQKLYSL